MKHKIQMVVSASASVLVLSALAQVTPGLKSEVYRHYGQAPAFTFIQRQDAIGDGQRHTDEVPQIASTRKADGTLDKGPLSKVKAGNILISVHTESPEEITRAKEIFTAAGAQCSISWEAVALSELSSSSS
jgi:hypothetical protein